MEAEAQRTVKGIRLKGHPKPFFVSYLTHNYDGVDVWGRYGSVFRTGPIRERCIYADVRVGSYRFDQTIDGSLATEMDDRESYNWLDAPDDLDPAALRYALWRLTQLKYGEALQDYYEKKKVLVEQHLRQDVPSFSKEKPLVSIEPLRRKGFDMAATEDFVRRASKRFRKHRHVEDPYVHMRSVAHTRLFVSSEGTRVVSQDIYHELLVQGWIHTPNGVRLNSLRTFYGRRDRDVPSLETVEAAIDEISVDLKAQVKAKPMEPYAAPRCSPGSPPASYSTRRSVTVWKASASSPATKGIPSPEKSASGSCPKAST